MEYTKTVQKPINSGFSAKTSVHEVIRGIDLSGKNVIITGGYSGIGLETARALCSAGANVIVPVRNKEKAREALSGLNVETEEMNLSDPESVDAFAEKFLASKRPLHLLINNAGIMAPPLTRDKQGYEMQFSTNHLGHFRLTARLFPALKKAAAEQPEKREMRTSCTDENAAAIAEFIEKNDGKKFASPPANPFAVRVITLSSRAHRRSAFDFDDPNYERTDYDPWKAYGRSKTANCLFAVELDRRAAKYGIRSFAVHPGLIPSTNISNAKNKHRSKLYRGLFGFAVKAMNALKLPVLFTALRRFFPNRRGNELKTIAQGAATTVFCAASPILNGMGGVYCEDCDIAIKVPSDSKIAYGVRSYAVDPKNAERLWRLSEELSGIDFNI